MSCLSNATVSVANVEDAHSSTRLLAQTTLRNILGTKDLYEILSNRESISGSMQVRSNDTMREVHLKLDSLKKCSFRNFLLRLNFWSGKSREYDSCRPNFSGRPRRGHGTVGNQGGASGDVSQSCGATFPSTTKAFPACI